MLRAGLPGVFVLVFAANSASAQHAPDSYDRPSAAPPLHAELPSRNYGIDAQHSYTLLELVEFAEEHNPETRAAWEHARSVANSLGIARSAFLPTVSAFAFGQSLQQGVLLQDGFHLQDLGIFEDGLELSYTIFEFGERRARVDIQKARLLAADLNFNDTHRKIIFAVSRAYYHLLEFRGRGEAARISLANAQTVQQASEERLRVGLGTLPDALEARSATAQADLELQREVGAEEIAAGELATELGLAPSSPVQIAALEHMEVPREIGASVDDLTKRAFANRPDLTARLAALQGSEAEIRGARSAFLPELAFTGNNAHLRAWGAMDEQSRGYASGRVWDARLSLKWNLFDGWRRENELMRARADHRAEEAELHAAEDRVENEVWNAFSNAKTSLRRRTAAAELLQAANESYSAALESYRAGVRTLIDVVSAQRTLAQAQSEEISSRAEVLLALSDLAFRTGEILSQTRRHP